MTLLAFDQDNHQWPPGFALMQLACQEDSSFIYQSTTISSASECSNFTLSPLSSTSCSTTSYSPDPVYQQDDGLLFHLILKERNEMSIRAQALQTCKPLPTFIADWDQVNPFAADERRLLGQRRHLLLSWMSSICEKMKCQDEIFPLATLILDKYLLLRPAINTNASVSSAAGQQDPSGKQSEDATHQADQLKERQLHLLAACSLLLAAKLRQTPPLSIAILINFSSTQLPVALSREEIVDCELLVLVTLKWDLASLVAPNDYLTLLLDKCNHLIFWDQAGQRQTDSDQGTNLETMDNRQEPKEPTVSKHTRSLIELCLMDSQLSQYSPSILAMASMAVAIDGLMVPGRVDKTLRRLSSIVAQIYEATHNVNELELMIDVACQIENHVQNILNSARHD